MATALRPTDVRRFETLLRAMHRRILKDLEQLEEEALGSKEHPIESQGDEGTQEEVEEMDLDLIEHEDVTVHEVSLALQRIEGGTFGHCVTCGEWIDHERLEVVPYARHCIACEQSSREPGPPAEDVTPVR